MGYHIKKCHILLIASSILVSTHASSKAEPTIIFPDSFSEIQRADLVRTQDEIGNLMGETGEGAIIEVEDKPVEPIYERTTRTLSVGTEFMNEFGHVVSDELYLTVVRHESTHLHFHQYFDLLYPSYYSDFDARMQRVYDRTDSALGQVGAEGVSVPEAMAEVRAARAEQNLIMVEGSLFNAYDELLADVIPSIIEDRENVVYKVLSQGAEDPYESLEFRRVTTAPLNVENWKDYIVRADEEFRREGVPDAYDLFAPARRAFWRNYQMNKERFNKADYVRLVMRAVLQGIEKNVINFQPVTLADLERLNSEVFENLRVLTGESERARGEGLPAECVTKLK